MIEQIVEWINGWMNGLANGQTSVEPLHVDNNNCLACE